MGGRGTSRPSSPRTQSTGNAQKGISSNSSSVCQPPDEFRRTDFCRTRRLRWFSRCGQFTRIGHIPGQGRPLLREGGPISYEARPSFHPEHRERAEGNQQQQQQRLPVRVVHSGRSTCHAMSGRGDWSTRIPDQLRAEEAHPLVDRSPLGAIQKHPSQGNPRTPPCGLYHSTQFTPKIANMGVVHLGRSTCHAISGRGD